MRQAERLERLDLPELVQTVSRHFKVSPAKLVDPTRSRSVSQAREALVFLAKRYAKQTTGDLSRYLQKDASAISHMFRRAEAKGETEEMQSVLVSLLNGDKDTCG